jgi:outer membrane protein assembly factor BamA
MRSFLPALVFATAASQLVCGVASAQEPPPSEAPPAIASLDVGDLWRLARHKEQSDADDPHRFLVFAPSIGSKPSTGLNGGFAGNVAFFSGDEAGHISSISGGVKVSQKKQTLSGVKLAVFFDDDQWFLLGDNRLSWTSQNTYALGSRAVAPGSANVKYDLLRLYETAYRTIEPGLFVGLGVNVSQHSSIRPGDPTTPAFDQSAYLAYSRANGFAGDLQRSGGTSVALLYDTRDNAINASRGHLASATYRTFFDGFLGGDSSWQELYLDLRAYKALTRDARQRVAFWFLGDLVTGGIAPFLDLPSTGGDTYGRSARGYAEGRYRGERLLYGEIEYRSTLTRNGLLGAVAFANTTTVSSRQDNLSLFDAADPAAGFGLRVLLNKRSRTNLCTDYAWGKAGARAFYLSIQEAF